MFCVRNIKMEKDKNYLKKKKELVKYIGKTTPNCNQESFQISCPLKWLKNYE